MKVLLTEGVLVAAFVRGHPDHARCHAWIERALGGEIEAVVTADSLAGVYAGLTTLPARPRILPEHARRLIEENTRGFTVLPLRVEDYRACLAGAASLGVDGTAVADAIALRAAARAGADTVVTLDTTRWQRLRADAISVTLP